MFVSRDEDGNLDKVPVPLHYAYLFVAAAAIGMFTITGLAGSYSRMLIKTARFNQLRQDHNSLQKDYVHLEKAAHEKDIQAASLGSLASEVSALYGLTANKLATTPPSTAPTGPPAITTSLLDESTLPKSSLGTICWRNVLTTTFSAVISAPVTVIIALLLRGRSRS